MSIGKTKEKKSRRTITRPCVILAVVIVAVVSMLALVSCAQGGYTLVFNVDGNETTSLVVKAKEEVVLPNPAAKSGYTFDGWYFDKDTWNEPCTAETLKGKKDLEGNVAVHSKWLKNVYTISYTLNGGENAAANPTTYAVDTNTIKLAYPTKVGYTFGGWYAKADFGDKAVTEIAIGSTGNKTLFAKWNAIEYKINYELNGGVLTGTYPTTYTIDKDTTLAIPTRNGYTFDGWYAKADLTDTPITAIAKGATSDKTFYAKWALATYTITYNGMGALGADNPNTTVSYDITTPTITLLDATGHGYTFAGWFDAEVGGKKVLTIENGSYGDKTLYAKWTAIEYGITYNLDGGTNSIDNPATYTIATPTITLATPTKSGYKFLGWFNKETDGVKVEKITSGGTGTVTVFARWEIVTYTITYELKGGSSANNPATYTVIDTITFADPTHADKWMAFDGWYSEDTFATKVTTIPTGSTENKTFYAKWNFTGTPGLAYTKSADSQAWEVAAGTVDIGVVCIPSKHDEAGEVLPVNIKTDAFLSKTKITKVVIEDGVKSIGDNAFKFCNTLASITIPNSVTSIGRYAFGSSDISTITIPDGVTTLEEYTFSGCTSLVSVKLPNSLKTIGDYAFNSCILLASITIPDGVTAIGQGAFSACHVLASVTIPDGVTGIREYTFSNCKSLVSVKIPSKVKNIGSYAFLACTTLPSIFIPSSVTMMGLEAFDQCTALTISCQRAEQPATGWNAKWMGNVPTTKILWGQPVPKLIP